MQIAMKIIFIAFCTFGFAVNKPIYDERNIENFLSHYGYLEKGLLGLNKNRNEIYIRDAISDFQHLNGINVTGIVDDDTMKIMQRPRCGVKDKIASRDVNQFVLIRAGRWELPNLTFAILNYPDNLNENEVVEEITSAFNIWTKYTNLAFVRKNPSRNVNILVGFASYDHGDAEPFDGPGQVVGHAFDYDSSRRGQIHLDGSESWTVNSSFGVSIFQVVAHEIGHVLGIDHSMFKEAIMTPNFEYNEDFRSDLNLDDIQAIQAIYGPKGETGKKPEKKVRNRKQICETYASQFYRFPPILKRYCRMLKFTSRRNYL